MLSMFSLKYVDNYIMSNPGFYHIQPVCYDTKCINLPEDDIIYSLFQKHVTKMFTV